MIWLTFACGVLVGFGLGGIVLWLIDRSGSWGPRF